MIQRQKDKKYLATVPRQSDKRQPRRASGLQGRVDGGVLKGRGLRRGKRRGGRQKKGIMAGEAELKGKADSRRCPTLGEEGDGHSW